MLKRKLYKELVAWRRSEAHGALLLTGPRQVGKSTLVEYLGKHEYSHLVAIDLALNPAARDALRDARDAGDFLRRVSLFSNGPMPEGDTLVFVDEIQELPDVMTMVKALVIDGRYDYAFSGSMLGTEFRGVRSYPVGFVHELSLGPMDFEEFLWASGASEAALEEVESNLLALEPVPDYLHDALLAYFRTYVVVGGMPQVVSGFVGSNGDLASVRNAQRDLVTAYRHDIQKYAGPRALNVGVIFDQLPLQLDKDSRRFVLNSVSDEARFQAYRQDFVWLVNAGVALKTNLVREAKSPLAITERPGMFKLYQSDVGMLVSSYHQQTARDIYLDSRSPNLGGVYENVVAQELRAAGYDLFYYMGKKRGEVDFVIETSDGEVVPIEVKSGRSMRTHAAMDNLLDIEEYEISRGIVLSRLNVEQDGKVIYLPWYATAWMNGILGTHDDIDNASFTLSLPKI